MGELLHQGRTIEKTRFDMLALYLVKYVSGDLLIIIESQTKMGRTQLNLIESQDY